MKRLERIIDSQASEIVQRLYNQSTALRQKVSVIYDRSKKGQTISIDKSKVNLRPLQLLALTIASISLKQRSYYLDPCSAYFYEFSIFTALSSSSPS